MAFVSLQTTTPEHVSHRATPGLTSKPGHPSIRRATQTQKSRVGDDATRIAFNPSQFLLCELCVLCGESFSSRTPLVARGAGQAQNVAIADSDHGTRSVLSQQDVGAALIELVVGEALGAHFGGVEGAHEQGVGAGDGEAALDGVIGFGGFVE